MKILYLCTFYHTAFLYRQQMEALNERGHYVRVFNSARYGEGVAEKFRSIMDEKVKHYECWNKFDRLFFFPRQWKIEKKLQEAYNLKEFNLLHSHLLVSSGFTARRMKKKYGLKYVVSIRVTDLTGFIRLPFFRNMAIKNAEEANGLLFLSRCHKREFMDKFVHSSKKTMFERKSIIIGNPLEKFWEEHTGVPRKSLIEVGCVKVLLVGRITPAKNIPIAVEAIELLRSSGIDASLTVVGEVEDKEEERKIKKYNFVKQLPFMSHEDLICVYKNHDIFLLPSKVETFGRVYTEAMSQGLPVLYTKGQGFDEIYPDGEVGYAVPYNDCAYIADRIRDVLNNYAEISARCINHVSDFYEKNIVDKIEGFYRASLERM